MPLYKLVEVNDLALRFAAFTILHSNEAASKALLQGCKFTWKSAFSQMWWHYQDVFVIW